MVKKIARLPLVGAKFVLTLPLWSVLLIAVVVVGWLGVYRVVDHPVFGDFIIANVARYSYPWQQQEFEAEYTYDEINKVWLLQTNSQWLADTIRDVIPFFEYEGVTGEMLGVSPNVALAEPMPGMSSFHLLGTANPNSRTFRINERLLEGSVRFDEKQALATVVHESIHLQRTPSPGVFNSTWAPIIEPNTQAATIEVLAAMCNYRNEVACDAFWHELWKQTSTSVELYAIHHNLQPLYRWYEDTFWLTPEDREAFAKSDRFWNSTPERKTQLNEILLNYGAGPWRKILVKGIRQNVPLNTGATLWFDDTRSMLGFWNWFVYTNRTSERIHLW